MFCQVSVFLKFIQEFEVFLIKIIRPTCLIKYIRIDFTASNKSIIAHKHPSTNLERFRRWIKPTHTREKREMYRTLIVPKAVGCIKGCIGI